MVFTKGTYEGTNLHDINLDGTVLPLVSLIFEYIIHMWQSPVEIEHCSVAYFDQVESLFVVWPAYKCIQIRAHATVAMQYGLWFLSLTSILVVYTHRNQLLLGQESWLATYSRLLAS